MVQMLKYMNLLVMIIYSYSEKESETVIEHYKNGDYDPLDFYVKDNKVLKKLWILLLAMRIMKIGSEENL